MEQIPKLTQLPSTPPLLNLSPDLRNFKSFFRSPTQGIDDDDGERHSDFGDLDFEAAYALLIQSPTFNIDTQPLDPTVSLTGTSTAFSAQPLQPQPQPQPQPLQPLQQYQQGPMNATTIRPHPSPSPHFPFQGDTPDQFKEFLFTTRTPSPRLGSPQPLFGLETLQQFPKHTSELLSVNETTALEQFLDSIIGGSEKKKQEEAEDDDNDNDIHIPSQEAGVANGTPPTTAGSSHASVSYRSPSLIPDPQIYTTEKKTSLSRSALNEGPNIIPQLRSSPDIPDEIHDTRQAEKKQRKRRKLLSEEEKKLHHTSSEQRRRGMIKDSFEKIVQLLPMNQTKKNQPKSIILQTAAEQIERLMAINAELQKNIDGQLGK